MPNLVTYHNQTSKSEWCVVRCGSKNEHKKDMCLKEVGLHAQNVITILDSVDNIVGGIYLTIY